MLRKITDAVADFLWPPRCILCGAPVIRGTKVCATCLSSLPVCKEYVLTPDARRETLYCLRAPFYYAGCARKGVLSLKFESVSEAADFFAQHMAKIVLPLGCTKPVVTAVPLSKQRQRRRKYNQSELIARQYALYKGLEYRELLTKTVNNSKQSLIHDFRLRRDNVRGCYSSCGEIDSGSDIILIDDVYTSGATMSECARILRERGASRVMGLSACTAHNRKRAETDAFE